MLSVIALITYPIIGNLINDGKDKLHDKQISEIERLSNTWVTRNIKKLKMEDGYTYKLTFEELNKSGLTSSSNIKDPKTGNDLPGCMIVTYNSNTKGYDVAYDSSCSGVIEKEPSINLTVDNGIINNKGYATKDFDVKVSGTNLTSYKYCKGTSECEPNINVNGNNGTIKIDQNGTTHVCVIGNNGSKSTNKLCKNYKLDKTELVAGTLVIDGTKGLNDWYVSDVKLSVRDTEGVTSTLNINEITEDTNGTEVVMTSTNNQTGAVKTTKYTIKVDKTKPTVGNLVINGTKGLDDWYTSNITFSVINGSDTTSGHDKTISNISSITSDTKGTNVIVTTIDKAGNQSVKTYTLKVDKTAPIPGTLTINGTKGVGEWYLSDVTLTVNNGSDTTSGHKSTTSSHTSITSNTDGTNVVVTTIDNAGNKATRNYTIKVNKNKPTSGTLVIDGTKGLDDWYVTDVKLSVKDAEGVTSTLNISEITEDTKGTEVVMTSTNNQTGAVNTTKYTIKVDKTKPIVGELVINGTKGLNDWYTSNLTFSVTNGSDTTSGHYQTTSNISSITNDTKGTNVLVTTIDKAGNQSVKTYTLKVDKTVPNIEMINPTNGNWTNQNIVITTNFSDSMSGINPSTLSWSDNQITWNSYSNTSTQTFSDTWSGEGDRTAYNRICDNAGNCSTANTPIRIATLLTDKIKNANPVIATDQTWTTSWQTSDPSGLYAQTVGSNKTYYFRGNPTNNYIKFAGKDFRILRVNEDGTIRIMLTSSIGNKAFNSTYNTYDKMYYTNSEIKTVVDDWFTQNITGENANKVVSGNYFCEQAKVVWDTSYYTAGSATVVAKESYTPTFECTTDGNGKGVVTSKVGLVTYDETIYAGGWYYVSGLSYPYYLNSGSYYWTMSPAGFVNTYNNADAWRVSSAGSTNYSNVRNTSGVRPVLILSADTLVSGSGTSADPYVVT